MAELETKLVQARTDSKAQVKGHNTGKKELEVGFGNNVLVSNVSDFSCG